MALMRSLIVVFSAAIMAGTATSAFGQPFVPPEIYDRTRPDFGNKLPLCVLPNSATLKRDRQVAREIAQVMLLEPDVVEMEINFDNLDGEGVWPYIFLALAEDCVGVMGVQLVPELELPDWLTITRPYFEAPYVLVTGDPDVGSVGDLPAGTRLASPVFTPIDNNLLTVMRAGGDMAGLKRLPYDDPELLAQLLEDGTAEAAIVWKPHLQTELFHGRDLYEATASVEPLQRDQRKIGIVMRSKDEMLRTNIDRAISAITQ